MYVFMSLRMCVCTYLHANAITRQLVCSRVYITIFIIYFCCAPKNLLCIVYTVYKPRVFVCFSKLKVNFPIRISSKYCSLARFVDSIGLFLSNYIK